MPLQLKIWKKAARGLDIIVAYICYFTSSPNLVQSSESNILKNWNLIDKPLNPPENDE
jgi:hypothetical protein